MTIAQLSFTTSTVVHNLPPGREVGIATDADLTVKFWNPVAGAYDIASTLVAPGGIIFCPIHKAEIVTADAANINIHLVL